MSGATVVIHKQNKLIRLFNEAGAIDAEHAISISEIGVRRSLVFNKMVSRGILIECRPDFFYINNNEVPRFNEQRRIRGIIAVVVFLIICALYNLFGRK